MNDEEIEIKVLLEAVLLKHGYDFRQYAGASLARRIRKSQSDGGFKRTSDMIPAIIHDKEFFSSFLHNLSVNVTHMFRNPLFFLALRENVIPYLKTYPFIKVWSVGVATGEEVYSLAILLEEEGLYDKALIYATDFNAVVLEKAKKGIYSAPEMKKSTSSYQKAGGKKSFASYYHADYNSVIMDRSLKRNIVFAKHNLVCDSTFAEMNIIVCRNVLIYFNKDLQEKAFHLFNDSLCNHGFLCLGNKETLNFSSISNLFTPIVKKQKVFQKKTIPLMKESR